MPGVFYQKEAGEVKFYFSSTHPRNFPQWAAWGRALMDLHLAYDQAVPFPLERHESEEPLANLRPVTADARMTTGEPVLFPPSNSASKP